MSRGAYSPFLPTYTKPFEKHSKRSRAGNQKKGRGYVTKKLLVPIPVPLRDKGKMLFLTR